MAGSWILGNRLDVLADLLARVLEEEGADPFAARVILVPSGEMKSWLLLELARRSTGGAVAGLRVFSWQEGMRYLLNEPGKELSYLELYLFVYEALKGCEEVKTYLESARLVDLAAEVADLFLEYGYYGVEFEEGWQAELWRKLFVEGPWKTPMQLFEKKLEGSVYCFGCLMMPPVIWEALAKIDDVKIFMFSPCAFYWADVRSDRERRSLLNYGRRKRVSEQEIEALQGYLLEDHPLLANWGKVGREVFGWLDSQEIEIESVYDPLEGREGMLAGLQKDLLWNRKSRFEQDDGSIRVHQTGASRLREVQVLRDEMVRLHREGVLFSDMLILAPDINVYAPLIQMVFADLELGIACHLSGVDESMQNGGWRGLKRLFDLAFSRWDAEHLLLLLENSSFREKREWDLETLDQIRSWIRDAKVRWGKTEEDKKTKLSEWLETKTFERRGTWERALEKMTDSLIYLASEESSSSGPSLAQADLLEEFLELLFSLQTDLAPLCGELKSPVGWTEYIRDLFEKYFTKEGSEVLEEVLYSIRKAGEKISHPIAFEALLHAFERRESGSIGSTLLHAARFASLQEGSITPCRALFLLGQDEESFPKRSFSSSIDVLRSSKNRPSLPSDRDRYLFLQAVCSPRDYLVISYGHISPEDGKEVGPSIVVRELLGYLSVVDPIAHPSFPWHPRCFFSSAQEYKAALVFQKPKEPLEFFPSLEKIVDFEMPKGEVSLSIKDLRGAFYHPWKFYLKKKLKLFFEEIEEEDWSDLEVGSIQRSSLLKQAMNRSIDSVIEMRRGKDAFPIGLFGEAERLRLEKTFDEWKEHVQKWNLEDAKPSSLRLFEENVLEIEVDGTVVKISGEIKHVFREGPVHFRDDSFSEMLKSWPEYLAALCSLKSRKIFCVRSGRPRPVENPIEALKECIRLYFLMEKTPLPWTPDWADALIRKQDPAELEKKFEGSFGERKDPLADWVLLHAKPFCPKTLVSCWGPYLAKRLEVLVEMYPMRGANHAKI